MGSGSAESREPPIAEEADSAHFSFIVQNQQSLCQKLAENRLDGRGYGWSVVPMCKGQKSGGEVFNDATIKSPDV